MDKKRGQALVEFIIILPILVFLILAIIDIGKMLYTKNQLESNMNTVIDNYEKDITTLKKMMAESQIEIEIKEDSSDYVKIELKKEIDIITPGLNLIFKAPYQVVAERMIPHES